MSNLESVAQSFKRIESGVGQGEPPSSEGIRKAIEHLVEIANDDPESFFQGYESLDALSADELSEVGGHAIDVEGKGAFHVAAGVWASLREYLVEGTAPATKERAQYLAALNLVEAATMLCVRDIGVGLVEQAAHADDSVFRAGLSLALIVHEGTGGGDLSTWVSSLATAADARDLGDDERSALDRLAKPRG